MKKFLISVIVVLFSAFCVIQLFAGTARPADYTIYNSDGSVTYIWANGYSSERAGWASVPGKAAGNYQCNQTGYDQCFLWDWMYKTSAIVLTDPSDASSSSQEIDTWFYNNDPSKLDPNYGRIQAMDVANQLGITLPQPTEAPELLKAYMYNGINIWW